MSLPEANSETLSASSSNVKQEECALFIKPEQVKACMSTSNQSLSQSQRLFSSQALKAIKVQSKYCQEKQKQPLQMNGKALPDPIDFGILKQHLRGITHQSPSLEVKQEANDIKQEEQGYRLTSMLPLKQKNINETSKFVFRGLVSLKNVKQILNEIFFDGQAYFEIILTDGAEIIVQASNLELLCPKLVVDFYQKQSNLFKSAQQVFKGQK